MNSDSTKKQQKKGGRIFFNGLILTAILTGFLMMGCMSPRSVRTGKKLKAKSSKKIEVAKDMNDMSNEELLKAQEELLAELKKNDVNSLTKNELAQEDIINKAPETNTKRKLPTLREQLNSVRDEQEIMKYKITDLQEDVSDVKETLEYIKDELNEMNNEEKEDAVAGEYLGDQFYEYDDDDATYEEDDNLILSDEQVKKKKRTTKQSKTKSIAKKSIKRSPKKKSAEKKEKVLTAANAKPKTTNIRKSNSEAGNSFKSAMSSFTQRNYHKAIAELNKIIRENPDKEMAAKCTYWLGESHFGLNQYNKAISYFNQVLKSSNTAKKDDAMIMIAEAQVRSGKINDAKKMFNDFIRSYPRSQFVPRARKMLQQL